MSTSSSLQKIRLVEEFMEVYEHTYDIVEQQRLLQIIVDIMAKRPRLNVDSTHFIDSYKSDIKYIDAMRELINEVVRDQKNRERNISNDIKEHLELKYRKINETYQQKVGVSKNKIIKALKIKTRRF